MLQERVHLAVVLRGAERPDRLVDQHCHLVERCLRRPVLHDLGQRALPQPIIKERRVATAAHLGGARGLVPRGRPPAAAAAAAACARGRLAARRAALRPRRRPPPPAAAPGWRFARRRRGHLLVADKGQALKTVDGQLELEHPHHPCLCCQLGVKRVERPSQILEAQPLPLQLDLAPRDQVAARLRLRKRRLERQLGALADGAGDCVVAGGDADDPPLVEAARVRAQLLARRDGGGVAVVRRGRAPSPTTPPARVGHPRRSRERRSHDHRGHRFCGRLDSNSRNAKRNGKIALPACALKP